MCDLAYAVAAHVDADILVVDEVLAVGDAEFQEKSLRHMRQWRAQRRRVWLVSHRSDAIKKLATGVPAWLDMGTVVESALVTGGLLDRYSIPR